MNISDLTKLSKNGSGSSTDSEKKSSRKRDQIKDKYGDTPTKTRKLEHDERVRSTGTTKSSSASQSAEQQKSSGSHTSRFKPKDSSKLTLKESKPAPYIKITLDGSAKSSQPSHENILKTLHIVPDKDSSKEYKQNHSSSALRADKVSAKSDSEDRNDYASKESMSDDSGSCSREAVSDPIAECPNQESIGVTEILTNTLHQGEVSSKPVEEKVHRHKHKHKHKHHHHGHHHHHHKDKKQSSGSSSKSSRFGELADGHGGSSSVGHSDSNSNSLSSTSSQPLSKSSCEQLSPSGSKSSKAAKSDLALSLVRLEVHSQPSPTKLKLQRHNPASTEAGTPKKGGHASSHQPSESPQKSHSSHSKSSSKKSKHLVNCGTQVSVKRKTDTKGVQVPESQKELHPFEKLKASLKGSTKSPQKEQGSPHKSEHHSKHRISRSTQTRKELPDIKGNQLKVADAVCEQDYRMKNLNSSGCQPRSKMSKYKHLMHVEYYPNGGASVIHSYKDELSKLSEAELTEFVDDYFDEVYGEPVEGSSSHVMGIIHGAVNDMPEPVEYFSYTYPNLTVTCGVLGKSDIETMPFSKFQEQVHRTYQSNTYRSGPLLQISLVGTVHEEIGDYYPDVIAMLEKDLFLKAVMPWGSRSCLKMNSPRESNDGPILWCRPGEQVVPTADMPKSPYKRKR